ncbi:hypothetical protein COCNU_06G001160 [Cocos nucifera]|uniref:Uncharacterized protein n=1 Tax=Cocos nucifera TaxID=13894 RepID=A0A8K0IAG4_COCNU|nr:hypothetical protein COCNU_06G001160 [Cocos nucifera]
MKNSTASTIIFLSTSTVVSAYQVRHGPWTVAFVLFACMDLLALFVCLRALKKLRPEDGMKESSKVAVWVFGNALNGAFAYPVAQMMPLALYVAVWGMSGFTIIVTFYGLFVYREPENLKNNDADMADFPSQAGQERGLAYDKRLALASVGHPESAAPPMIDAGQTANQIISGRNLATGSRSTKR